MAAATTSGGPGRQLIGLNLIVQTGSRSPPYDGGELPKGIYRTRKRAHAKKLHPWIAASAVKEAW